MTRTGKIHPQIVDAGPSTKHGTSDLQNVGALGAETDTSAYRVRERKRSVEVSKPVSLQNDKPFRHVRALYREGFRLRADLFGTDQLLLARGDMMGEELGAARERLTP